MTAREDAAFWRNFCWLKPFAVSTSTRVIRRPPVPPSPTELTVEPMIVIPAQRSRTSVELEAKLFGPPVEKKQHPRVPELTEQALRQSNKGGRA